MRYYYQRPGEWLWQPHETSSLAEDLRRGTLRADWRYRVEGEAEERSLVELLEAERAPARQPLTPAEVEMRAPDGTWGFIVVAVCALLLASAIFVPSRQGA